MKKKLALFILAAVLLLASCADGNREVGTDSGQSTENAALEDDFVFAASGDGTCELLRYNGGLTDVTILSEWNGMTVASIASFAFNEDDDLARVVIPEGITEIKACAFAGCSSLAEIVLPESAVKISKESFEGTPWYSGFDDGFVITNGTVLEYRGYEETTTSLEIPDGTFRIGDKAFAGLAIKSLSVPDSVVAIGERAFNNCTSLMRISLPEGISEIGYAAFHNTAWYNMQDGAVVIGDILVGCKNGTLSVTIPDKVRTIAGGAFLGSSAIALNVPEGVERIYDYAFSGCTQIAKISLPSTVSEIGEHAFDLCPTLEVIHVSEENPYYSSIDGVLCKR